MRQKWNLLLFAVYLTEIELFFNVNVHFYESHLFVINCAKIIIIIYVGFAFQIHAFGQCILHFIKV